MFASAAAWVLAYRRKGELDLAIKDFDAAINLDPRYGAAFINRAEIHELQGDHSEALKDFDQAFNLQPNTDILWNERCWTRAILGDLQGALADCNEAIRLQPNVAAGYDSRGSNQVSGIWLSQILILLCDSIPNCRARCMGGALPS
jgi:tetratricopeptide (TPR) repeat protein